MQPKKKEVIDILGLDLEPSKSETKPEAKGDIFDLIDVNANQTKPPIMTAEDLLGGISQSQNAHFPLEPLPVEPQNSQFQLESLPLPPQGVTFSLDGMGA